MGLSFEFHSPGPGPMSAVTSLAHLVTCREAGQVRQDLQNIYAAKSAVMIADMFIGFFLSKRHHCSDSEERGSGPGMGGWTETEETRLEENRSHMATALGVRLDKRQFFLTF